MEDSLEGRCLIASPARSTDDAAMTRRLAPLACSLALALASSALADVTLAPFFRDHAVIQRDQPIRVSGTASPGEKISVTFGGASGAAEAAQSGAFLVALPAQPASSTPRDLVVRGANTVTVHDVLVGDVWLCSGQSNMEWVLGQLPDAADHVAKANDSEIRYFKTEHALSWSPKDSAVGAWSVANGEAARGCTAIGYLFARELRQSQKVPIGILDCSWGGTKIEPWLPQAAVQRDVELQGEWNAAKKRGNGETPPNQDSPTAMWNGMVAPFVGIRIKGVAWYQGESNAHNASRYRRSLPLLIEEWRKAFGDEDLPFGVFQLASFMPFRADLPVESGWAELRESQRGGASAMQAGLVVLIDIGDANDIHPAKKAEAARRLGLWARAKAYGESVEFSGPVFRRSTVEGDRIVLTFDHASGLAARDGKPLGGFAIAGADGAFVWATATIDGETVVVRADGIAAPTQVRYAWHNNPETANLVNGAGLPAGPFRTDVVPIVKPKRR